MAPRRAARQGGDAQRSETYDLAAKRRRRGRMAVPEQGERSHLRSEKSNGGRLRQPAQFRLRILRLRAQTMPSGPMYNFQFAVIWKCLRRTSVQGRICICPKLMNQNTSVIRAALAAKAIFSSKSMTWTFFANHTLRLLTSRNGHGG